MTPPVFFLGVDGGGTGCRARLTDADGVVLGEGQGGPASLRLGIAAAWPAIETAINAALAAAGLDAHRNQIVAGFGLAGISRGGARAEVLARAQAFRAADCTSDGMAACLGAHGGRDGGIVIAGTGSVALAVRDGAELRLGGYGIPASDEGSGAAIGVAAVGSLLKALDGRVARGAFHEEVAARFSGGTAAIVAWMDGASGTDYAALAPLALAHAQAGDSEARRIVTGAAEDIAALIRALHRRDVARIALMGGLAAPLRPWLAADAAALLCEAQGDGVDGALILARRLAPSAMA